jgi:sulfur carrier protein
MSNATMKLVVNGQERVASDRITLAELLAEMDLSPTRVAVEVNLEVVPRGEHQTHVLRDGDRLEIVTFVGGG